MTLKELTIFNKSRIESVRIDIFRLNGNKVTPFAALLPSGLPYTNQQASQVH
jgi:hypothetical protein